MWYSSSKEAEAWRWEASKGLTITDIRFLLNCYFYSNSQLAGRYLIVECCCMQLLYMKDRLPRPKDPPTLTIPHEFSFHTNHRVRMHQGDTKETKIKVWEASLLQSMCIDWNIMCFSCFVHITYAIFIEQTSPFVSMAERVRRFHLKTPERYHIQSVNSSGQVKILNTQFSYHVSFNA